MFFAVALGATSAPRVTLSLGEVEGFTAETVSGRTYYAFEGVPYARPPVGKYRFKVKLKQVEED